MRFSILYKVKHSEGFAAYAIRAASQEDALHIFYRECENLEIEIMGIALVTKTQDITGTTLYYNKVTVSTNPRAQIGTHNPAFDL